MRPALTLLAIAVAATPAAADVAWEAPPGCPDADAFRAAVVERLGRELRAGEVDARLVVSRRGARHAVVITTAEGERELEAASCAELAESAAVILAMTIGEAASAGEPEVIAPPETAPAAEEPPRIRVVDDEVPGARRQIDTSVPAPRPPRPIEVRARGTIAGDLGSLPAPAPGIGAGVEVALGGWSIDAALHRWASREAAMPVTAGDPMPPSADVGLTTIVARGCYSDGPARWRAGGCLGGELGFTRAAGEGFDTDEVTVTESAGVQLGASGSIRLLGPLALRADVTATWQVVRPVLVEGVERTIVHDMNALVWRGFAGVEATWR